MGDSTHNRNFQKRRLLKNSWQLLKKEAPALTLFVPLFVGALSSGAIIADVTGITLRSWVLLAIAISIMNLPKTFSKNKPNECYTIRFARAFRDGFIPMYSAIQCIAEILDKIRSKSK